MTSTERATPINAYTPDTAENARRPMMDDELRMARALGRCSFVPDTAPKRFAREIAAGASAQEPTITERQAGYLRHLVSVFRRQIAYDVVLLVANPDVHCPMCGGPMLDNRPTKRQPTAADWKCARGRCRGERRDGASA